MQLQQRINGSPSRSVLAVRAGGRLRLRTTARAVQDSSEYEQLRGVKV